MEEIIEVNPDRIGLIKGMRAKNLDLFQRVFETRVDNIRGTNKFKIKPIETGGLFRRQNYKSSVDEPVKINICKTLITDISGGKTFEDAFRGYYNALNFLTSVITKIFRIKLAVPSDEISRSEIQEELIYRNLLRSNQYLEKYSSYPPLNEKLKVYKVAYSAYESWKDRGYDLDRNKITAMKDYLTYLKLKIIKEFDNITIEIHHGSETDTSNLPKSVDDHSLVKDMMDSRDILFGFKSDKFYPEFLPHYYVPYLFNTKGLFPHNHEFKFKNRGDLHSRKRKSRIVLTSNQNSQYNEIVDALENLIFDIIPDRELYFRFARLQKNFH